MARYEKNLGETTLSVGWDEPMNTFFAQVHTNQADDDLRDLPLVLWLGGEPDEYLDFEQFVKKLEASGYLLEQSVKAQIFRDFLGGNQAVEKSLEADGWRIKR